MFLTWTNKRPVWDEPHEGTPGGETTPEGEPPVEGETTPEGEPTGQSLLGEGENKEGDEGAATAEEPLTADGLKEILPENFEMSDEQSSELLETINGAESRADLVGKLLGMYQTAITEQAEQASQVWADTQRQWQDEVRSSPEYGGDKLDQSLANAKEVVKRYGGEDFSKLLNLTGAGNSLAMVKFLNAVHKEMVKEGNPIVGAPATSQKSLADRLFSS